MKQTLAPVRANRYVMAFGGLLEAATNAGSRSSNSSNDVVGFWKKNGFEETGRVLSSVQANITAQIIEMIKAL